MTEPSGRRRRRRSGASGTSSWASRSRRSLVAVGVIAVIILAAAGLSIALGGGVPPSDSPSQAQASFGSPGASPTRTPVTSFPPVATSLPSASPSPSPTAGVAVKANRIQIERLGIDLKIIEGDGIDAPIGKVAHFPGTDWPGGGSNIYIYGHARTGMFLSLWDIKKGDEVVLTLVDGSQRTYVIAKVIPKAPWDAIEYLDPTPTEQLTLQTSTSYHPTSPRFIAIAFPAP